MIIIGNTGDDTGDTGDNVVYSIMTAIGHILGTINGVTCCCRNNSAITIITYIGWEIVRSLFEVLGGVWVTVDVVVIIGFKIFGIDVDGIIILTLHMFVVGDIVGTVDIVTALISKERGANRIGGNWLSSISLVMMTTWSFA